MDLKDPERIWMSKTEALAYVQRGPAVAAGGKPVGQPGGVVGV